MRADAIRTFAAGYHGGRLGNALAAREAARPVVSTRLRFGAVGLALAVTGVIVARSGLDPYIGLALVIVGAFLLVLPFTRLRQDE